MQFSSIFNIKKFLSLSLIFSSSLIFTNSFANNLSYQIKFDNNKPIDYKKIEERSSVFRAPIHWQAGMNEKHVWVEPEKGSINKFEFYARNGQDINNPNWAHKRAAGARFFSW